MKSQHYYHSNGYDRSLVPSKLAVRPLWRWIWSAKNKHCSFCNDVLERFASMLFMVMMMTMMMEFCIYFWVGTNYRCWRRLPWYAIGFEPWME